MLRVGAERGDVLSNPHGERWRPWLGAWAFSSPSGPFHGFSPQLAHPYRTMVLRAMETIVSNHISELGKDMARAIILLASSEMTKVKVCAAGQAPQRPGAAPAGCGRGSGASFSPSMLACGFGSGCLGVGPSVLHIDRPPGWGGPPCHFRGGNRSRRKFLSSRVNGGAQCPHPDVWGTEPGSAWVPSPRAVLLLQWRLEWASTRWGA